MEYANGGELFDYIVANTKLEKKLIIIEIK